MKNRARLNLKIEEPEGEMRKFRQDLSSDDMVDDLKL